MHLTKNEKRFLVITFPFYFLMGPFQVLALLSTGWGVQLVVNVDNPMQPHHFPIAQIIDNFVGMPAIWIITFVLYAAYRRGHFGEMVAELLEAFNGVNRSKSRDDHNPAPRSRTD